MLTRILLFAFMTLCINLPAAVNFHNGNEPDKRKLDIIRNKFYLAVEDGAILDELVEYIEDIYQSDFEKYPAVVQAYYGALETLKAKHSYNPYNKFRYVIAGLKKLNSAVEKSPQSLEVRFLRFAVLHNIPGIFGITAERNDDLRVTYAELLKEDYSSIERDLQKGIAEFLLRSGRLEYNQAEKLKNIFPEVIE